MPEIRRFNEEHSEEIGTSEPGIQERREEKGGTSRRDRENLAVTQFLQNYQCAKSSSYQQARASKSSWTTSKQRNIEEKEPLKSINGKAEKVTKEVGKSLYIAAAIAVIAAVGSLLFVLKPSFLVRTNKEQETINDIARYKEYSAAAIDASPEFNYTKWESPDKALEGLASLVNPGLPADMYITTSANESYALAGEDPWGTPYYITAKQLGTEGEAFTYASKHAGSRGWKETSALR